MIIFNEHDQDSKTVVSIGESSFLVNILGDNNYQFSVKFQELPGRSVWALHRGGCEGRIRCGRQRAKDQRWLSLDESRKDDGQHVAEKHEPRSLRQTKIQGAPSRF